MHFCHLLFTAYGNDFVIYSFPVSLICRGEVLKAEHSSKAWEIGLRSHTVQLKEKTQAASDAVHW